MFTNMKIPAMIMGKLQKEMYNFINILEHSQLKAKSLRTNVSANRWNYPESIHIIHLKETDRIFQRNISLIDDEVPVPDASC